MKGYLLLENGVTYNCTVSGEQKNVLGALTKSGAGVSIRCCTTGKDALISPKSSAYTLEVHDAEKLLSHMKSGIKGKIVVDALPLEYHLYDLKSDLN